MYRIVSLIAICIVLSLSLQHGECCKDSYFIGITEQWFQGINHTIFVNLYNKVSHSNPTVKINVNIASDEDPKNNYQVKSHVSAPTYRGLIQFQLPNSFPSGSYNVTIEGRGKNINFKNSTIVSYTTNTNGIYVVTDKPVYRALDQVNVKVIGIDPKLLSLNKNLVSVYFLDPNEFIIKQYIDVPFVQGLVDNLTLDISDRPQLGRYRIKVVENSNENTIYETFEILEYVLPKFDFTVSPPDYVLQIDDFFQGSIEAKYTYGKPLEGEAYIKLENQNSGFVVERIIKLNNGKITFTVPVMAFNAYTLKLTVNVTEQFTRETQQKQIFITVYSASFYVSLDSNVFVPGKNSLRLNINNPIGKPIPNLNLGVDATFITGPLDNQPSNKSYSVKTGIDGKATLNLDVSSTTIQLIVKIKRLDTSEVTKLLLFKKKASTNEVTNNNEFEITLQNKLKANSQAKILLTRRSNCTTINNICESIPYMIISRSTVLNSGTIKLCSYQSSAEINFHVTYLHAPYSTLILYYVNATKALIVQSQKFEVNGIYNNEISLAFDRATAEPGDQVTLTVNSKPNSIASIVVIDQSVALFRPPIELTNNQILSQIDQYQTNWYDVSPILKKKRRQIDDEDGYWQFPETLFNLEGNGFAVLSDLCSLEPKFQKFGSIRRGPSRGTGGRRTGSGSIRFLPRGSSRRGSSARGGGLAQVDRIRNNFRESWIWTTLKTDKYGKASIKSQIPDTITTWVASGFSLSDTYGIAIANKTNITGFQPFFITLNLPISIIRGEVFTLQAIVSNFLTTDLSNVVVTLSKSTEFRKVTILNNQYQITNVTNDIQITIPSIPSNSARSVSFPIVATKAGLIDLTVKAQSTVAADGLTQKLRVKFEGIEENYNLPYSVDLGSSTWLTRTGTFSERASLTFPSNTLQGSQYCEVQVIGDLLGYAFSNIDRLTVKPYGCGEQNLLTLTPNIYAYNYLQVVNRKGSQALIDKTKANILFGYQNQLRYRRFDDSFSAFGIIDDNGSSWLTALVIKSFSQAAKIIEIDQSVITNAILWLLKQQNSDGSFEEPGNIIHREMQSGTNKNETQTAYIAISLLEANITTPDVTDGIKKALDYLESKLSSVSDVYALSLITYALTLGKSSSSQTAFNKFNALANTTSTGFKYWSRSGSDDYSQYYWRRYLPTNTIEMTSYGLLTQLLRNDISGSVPIVRWLITKTNDLGAYGSTQSTILGLQALSTFGARTNAGGNDNLTVRVDSSSNEFRSFNVNNDNALVLQSWPIGTCPSSLTLGATGTGNAFLQVIVTYNVPKLSEPPVFTLTQTVKTKISCSNYVLETCARYNGSDDESGMSIIESNILSGFSVDQSQLNRLVDAKLGLKLVELSRDRSKVSFYFDKLTKDAKCVTWSINRDYPVSSQQPVPVRVYDYYKPELQTTVLFNVDSCNLCELTNDVSGCTKQ